MTEIDLGLPEREFQRIDLTGKVPDEICVLCARNAIRHVSLGVAATFCTHRGTGAWHIRGAWKVKRQIRPDAFAERLRWVLGLAKLQSAYERDCRDNATRTR
jgi:hypothetical protein